MMFPGVSHGRFLVCSTDLLQQTQDRAQCGRSEAPCQRSKSSSAAWLFFRNEVRAGARAHSSNESAAQGHSDHVLRAGVRSEFRARRRGGGASAHRPVEPSQASPPLGCSVHRGWLRSWPWSWVTRRRCSGGLGHHRGSGRGRQVHLGHLGVDRDAGPQGGR